MPVPPWVIDELNDERARREEQERARSQRIELPQTPFGDGDVEPRIERGVERGVEPVVGLVIVDISPAPLGTFDL